MCINRLQQQLHRSCTCVAISLGSIIPHNPIPRTKAFDLGIMSSSNRRRRHGEHVSLWLRRNVWLVAAATLVVIYCVFMVRTTMWARAFGTQEQQAKDQQVGETVGDSKVMKDALAALRDMGALKGEDLKEEAEEQAEEAAEDGREQLVKGEGDQEAVGEVEAHNQHPEATARPRLRPGQEEDTVAFDDKIPLGGDVPVVGATAGDEVQDLLTKKTEDHKWTSFDDLPLADASSKMRGEDTEEVTTGSDVGLPESTAMKPMTATVKRTKSSSDHLWTGVDKLPVAQGPTTLDKQGDTVDSAAPIQVPGMVSEVSATVDAYQPQTLLSRRFDESRLVLQKSYGNIPFKKRHDIIAGYNATLAYLQNYTKPADSKEELFLFFTCGDDQGGEGDWTPQCAEAREKVYSTFAKSPSANRLVTIYTGSQEYWKGGNEFTDDIDIRLKAIPTVMRWDGGTAGALRSTWGMLVGQSIMYEPLLHYLFRNADKEDKLLAQPAVTSKEIVTLRGYVQYRAFMETYASAGTPYPLFMMMVSGRFQRNNRLWCPWCRQSEMPVEYAFYAYAPANAKLVLVETYDKYSEWRNSENEFKKDPQLAMKGVPWFYRVFPGPPGQPLTYQRVKQKFYVLEALQLVFEGGSRR